ERLDVNRPDEYRAVLGCVPRPRNPVVGYLIAVADIIDPGLVAAAVAEARDICHRVVADRVVVGRVVGRGQRRAVARRVGDEQVDPDVVVDQRVALDIHARGRRVAATTVDEDSAGRRTVRAGVGVPADRVVVDVTGGPAAHLDAVLRDEADSTESGDGVVLNLR